MLKMKKVTILPHLTVIDKLATNVTTHFQKCTPRVRLMYCSTVRYVIYVPYKCTLYNTCDSRQRGGMHETGRRHRHVHNRTRPRRAATAGLKQRRRRPSRRTTHRRCPPPFRLIITMPPRRRRRSRARRRTSSLHR